MFGRISDCKCQDVSQDERNDWDSLGIFTGGWFIILYSRQGGRARQIIGKISIIGIGISVLLGKLVSVSV